MIYPPSVSPTTRSGRRFILYRPDLHRDTQSLGMDMHASFLFEGDVGAVVTATPTPEMMSTISYLKLSSFVYSLTNITSLAVPFILKDTLLLSPAQLALFSALCSTPAFLKPISTVLIRPQNRPTALVTCAATQAAMYLAVGIAVGKGVSSVPLVCGCMFAHSVASAVGMVLRDSMMIESAARLDSDSAAHFLFADISMIQRIGLVPVSYLSGYLLSYVSPAAVVASAAICPAIMAVAAALLCPCTDLDETPSGDQMALAIDQIKNVESGLLSTTTGRSLALSLVPSYADAMFFYYTQEMGLSAEFLGRFQFLGSIAGIAGNLLSRHSTDPQTLSNIANITSVPLYFSVLMVIASQTAPHSHILGLTVGTFILARHFLIDFVSSLTALPAAVQLMRTAPKGAEGVYLALVGTAGDVGGVVNSLVSSAAMHSYGLDGVDFSTISHFVILCNSMTAATLPALLYYGDAGKGGVPPGKEDDSSVVHEVRELTPVVGVRDA